MSGEGETSVTIGTKALVAQDAVIEGVVSIGDETVIHPGAVIRALGGPIIIGKRNVIEENVRIENLECETKGEEDGGTKDMVIGSLNVFEVGCHVQASKIGDYNVVEPKAVLTRNSTLGSGCVVAAAATVPPGSSVADDTVVFFRSDDGRTHFLHQPSCRERNVTHILQYQKALLKTMPTLNLRST